MLVVPNLRSVFDVQILSDARTRSFLFASSQLLNSVRNLCRSLFGFELLYIAKDKSTLKIDELSFFNTNEISLGNSHFSLFQDHLEIAFSLFCFEV